MLFCMIITPFPSYFIPSLPSCLPPIYQPSPLSPPAFNFRYRLYQYAVPRPIQSHPPLSPYCLWALACTFGPLSGGQSYPPAPLVKDTAPATPSLPPVPPIWDVWSEARTRLGCGNQYKSVGLAPLLLLLTVLPL